MAKNHATYAMTMAKTHTTNAMNRSSNPMPHALSAAFIVAMLMLSGCRENKVVGDKPQSDIPRLSVSGALQPENYNRIVTVQGVVKEVCQEEGCWMTITDGTKTLRMTFKDEAFRVALKSAGEVVVTGIVHEEIVPQDAVHAIGSSIGMSDESLRQLSGDQRWPLMTASGVEFLQPQH